MSTKIKSQPALVKIVQNLKKQGKKIVAFSGSFDILHVGHIKSLQEAKKQGDVLIILLNSDKSVRGYKGPNRPINSQKHRAEMLAALECVDYITIFDELNAKKILAKIKPDVLCNGADYGKYFIERKLVEDYGGRIHITKWTKHFSTSNLIKKILEAYSKPPVKAIFINLGTSGVSTSDIPNINNRFQDVGCRNIKIEDYKILYGHFDAKTFAKLVKRYGISLNNSWLISDKEKDIIIAKENNLKTIKIGDKLPKNLRLEPDYYVNNLKRAVCVISGKN